MSQEVRWLTEATGCETGSQQRAARAPAGRARDRAPRKTAGVTHHAGRAPCGATHTSALPGRTARARDSHRHPHTGAGPPSPARLLARIPETYVRVRAPSRSLSSASRASLPVSPAPTAQPPGPGTEPTHHTQHTTHYLPPCLLPSKPAPRPLSADRSAAPRRAAPRRKPHPRGSVRVSSHSPVHQGFNILAFCKCRKP